MKIRILLLILLLYITGTTVAQSIPSDLSNIRAAQISDQQLVQMLGQLKNAGYTIDDIYDLAVARGMNPIEAQALRTRADGIMQQVKKNQPILNTEKTQYQPFYRGLDTIATDILTAPENKLKIFGAELFNKGKLTFEPNLRMATPKNYILGPDDEIVIDIFGYQEANHRLKITPDGNINIPYVGVIYINGLTIEQATNRIIDKLSKNGYSNINSGRTKVQISLGSIRSIKITLLGQVKKPGTYTLPSLATVFNALYSSGGPTDNGSFRNIQIIRNNTIVDTLDIYDFLVQGIQSHNIRLEDQDVIRIPTYTKRVTITGQIKREGIYEIKQGEHLTDILNFAGGFSDTAYTAAISVIQNTNTQKKVIDVSADSFATYIPKNADIYTIGKILDKYENRVQIQGAVFRPGSYEWKNGLTLLQLIEKAQGLKEDAFIKRGIITRLKPDLTPSYINFNIDDILSHNVPDITLQKEDIINIRSIFDLKEQFNVSIEGEIRTPAQYNYYEGMTLQDLILLAGGFKENASTTNIEIARRLKNGSPLNLDSTTTSIIKIGTAGDIFDMKIPIILEPFDKIVVHSSPSYFPQKTVKVEGAVLYPGDYSLATQNERVSNLLRRAGGLLPTANQEATYILRLRDTAAINKRKQQLLKTLSTNKDSVVNEFSDESLYDRLTLNLDKIKKQPGSSIDVFLVEGDILRIEKNISTVKISGFVYTPSIQPYEKGRSLKYYIDNAGGLTTAARKRGIHIIYPNGEARKVKKFLFFTTYPQVKPGSEIVVPKIVREKRGLSTAEVISITTATASLATVVLVLINNLKK